MFLKLPFAMSFSVFIFYFSQSIRYSYSYSYSVFRKIMNFGPIYIYIYGNYIGETSNRLRLRLNNHKKSIGENSRGFPVAVHFNQPDHSHRNWRCVILRGYFKTTADRIIYEQTLIHKFKAHSKGANQDLSCLSPFDSQRVSYFLFVPLRPFFYAAHAKRWKVQFRQG